MRSGLRVLKSIFWSRQTAHTMLDRRAPRRDSAHHLKRGVAFPCQHCETAFTSPLFLEKHGRYCRGLRAKLAKIPAVVGSRPPDPSGTGPDAEGHRQLPYSVCETSYTGRRSLAKQGGERACECLDCGERFSRNSVRFCVAMLARLQGSQPLYTTCVGTSVYFNPSISVLL
uniref:C2H2-type domain-containing protein n=1 Tax=Timema tahoe TaxID=61484 RepID=A0A7R9IQ96_9NEOP|nr:unnamed protein product [Timema tahoe]